MAEGGLSDHDGVCLDLSCPTLAPDLCPTVWTPDGSADLCAPLPGTFLASRPIQLAQPGTLTGASTWRRTYEPVEIPLKNGILDDSVVGYWKLDGDGTDWSGKGNHGVVTGAVPSYGVYETEGGALAFDGEDDFVSIPHSSDISFGNRSFSVSLWFRTENDEQNYLIGKDYNVYGPFWGISAYGVFPGGPVEVTDGVSAIVHDGVVSSVVVSPNINVTDDQWHHVVFVRDREWGKLQLYVDGSFASSTADLSGTVENSADLFIGDLATTSTNVEFDGSIDEVLLFRRALSPTEIAAYYQSHAPYATDFVPGAQADLDDIRITEISEPGGEAHQVPFEVLGPRPHSDTPCPLDDTDPTTVPHIADREDLCGVVGYWKLDGDVEDVLGNYDATNSGAVLAPGRFGANAGAMAFDGTDDYVSLDGSSMSGLVEYTVEFFMMPSVDMVPDSGRQDIFYRGFPGNVGINYDDVSGRLMTGFYQSFGGGADGLMSVTHEIEFHHNTWVHIAVSKTLANDLAIYVDGIQVDEGTVVEGDPGPDVVDHSVLDIGRRPDGQFFFSGKLDELLIHAVAKSPEYIYRRANPGVPTVRFLASTEVEDSGGDGFDWYDYTLHWGDVDAAGQQAVLKGLDGDECYGLLSSCLGYAGWWRFNEGSGDVAVDSSTWKRNGLLGAAEGMPDYLSGMPAYVGGVDGTALQFDGNDDNVTIPDFPAWQSGEELTVQGLVRRDSTNNTDTIAANTRSIADDDGCPQFQLYFSEESAPAQDPGDRLTFYTADTNCSVGFRYWADADCATNGSWGSVSLVHKFGTAQESALYENASQLAGTWHDDLLPTFSPLVSTMLTIGNRQSPGQGHFGLIDLVRISSRALTEDEFLHYPMAAWTFGDQVGFDCGGVICPELSGYTVTCNGKAHCEYANEDDSGWKEWDVWIYIAPGSFQMGSTGEGGESNETPVHPVTIGYGYFVSKYEIVVSQYEACNLDQPGICTTPSTVDWNGYNWGTNYWEDGTDPGDGNNIFHDRPNHPQNGLTWQQAKDFCGWAAPGGRLPSEAEWEYAATGPVHLKYPWGDSPVPTCQNETAVFSEIGGSVGLGCGTGGTLAVGSKAAGTSWCGTLDMSGNLWEWTEDCWHGDYTDAPDDGSAWVSPANSDRAMRGGGINAGAVSMRSAERANFIPSDRDARMGARCLRPLP